MLSFDDIIEQDHFSILNTNEFAAECLNNSNSQVFNVIKTDAFISVDGEGLPIVEDVPMFNTSKKYLDEDGIIQDVEITQFDVLTIEGNNYRVRESRPDGIGGIDIYLKDSSNV